MKITTYNSDGSINEVREHYVQVPKYITSFDEARSFLNISEIELATIRQRKNSFEKLLVIRKMKSLIMHDYANYLNDHGNVEKTYDEIKNILHQSSGNIHVLREKEELLSSILRCYTPPFYPVNIERYDAVLCSDGDLAEVMICHIGKQLNNTFKDNDFDKFFVLRALLNLIHKLYYATKHCLLTMNIPEDGIALLRILHPFATLKAQDETMSIDFNDRLISRMTEALFGKEDLRKEIYQMFYILRSLSTSHSSNNYLAMKTGANQQNNSVCVFPKGTSNEVETTEILFTPEEMISLHVQCNASKELIENIRVYLQKEYDTNAERNGSDIEEKTNKNAIRRSKQRTALQLSKQNWSDFYLYRLNELEDSYKRCERKNEDLDNPYYYYYLLVDLCDIYKKYEFDGDFLNALVNLALNKKCEKRQDLYTQMYQLNYIGKNAGFIIETEVRCENDKRKAAMEALRQELLSGSKQSIAKKLCTERQQEDDVNDEIAEKVIVFLRPLFFPKYLNKESEIEKLELTLRNILLIEEVQSALCETGKGIIPSHFNIKLVLNIIGFLINEKGERPTPFLKKRISRSLANELIALWELEKASSYRKYITGYDDQLNGYYRESWSLITKGMKEKLLKALID